MPRIHTQPPKWSVGAMSPCARPAMLVLLLLLVAALIACRDGDRPMPKLGVTGTGETEFVSVSAGSDHTCGVTRDGSVECWGDNTEQQSTPPSGEFISVSAGAGYSCGVRSDRAVQCWGDPEDGRATAPSGVLSARKLIQTAPGK